MKTLLWFCVMGLYLPFTVIAQELKSCDLGTVITQGPVLCDLGAVRFDENKIAQELDPRGPSTARIEGGVSIKGANDFVSGAIHRFENNESIDMFIPLLMPMYKPFPINEFQIRFRIFPEPEHIGKESDILLTALYFDLDLTMASFFALDNHGGIHPLENISVADAKERSIFYPVKIADIPAFDSVSLEAEHDFLMYSGPLPLGYFILSAYYRLEDDTVVGNSTWLGVCRA